ncbi:MAG: hypothetical protein IJC09_04930 [Clostridia bacterium]|nr:hypothetical protein [Clostridia bacterium]
MSKITEVDKNLKIETKIEKDDIVFYNALEEPFKIYGIYHENGRFRRMPESVAKATSDGVLALHANTAGGRVRFKTDSPYIAINAVMDNPSIFPHCAATGTAGFDLYRKKDGKDEYLRTFTPPAWDAATDIKDGYESVIDMSETGFFEYTINFPTYSDVKMLYIGLAEGSKLESPTPYKYEKPIIYYGSSITQGGCSARPGITYQSYITRRFDYDHINLGFSGSAKAEPEMIEYIKNLDMSIFVYDYDHNAPSVEHLRNTHEVMFKAIREAQPELPIIMMSRPVYYLSESEKERLEIIKTTYNNAIANGDRNVYLIEGPELMKYAKNEGTVDGCHPNDLGFASMAKVLGDFLEKLI